MQTEKDNPLININTLKQQNSNSLPKFLVSVSNCINFNYFWLKDSITIMIDDNPTMNNDDDDDDDDDDGGGGGGGGNSEDYDDVNQNRHI